ncbi:MAG: hypothetical protein K6E97_05530 [Treponema sp.]|nr:hypothetical protein [Treponema sp.]
MSRSITAFSDNQNYEKAFEEVCLQIDSVGKTPKLIVFTSDVDVFWYYAENIKKRYPEAITIGSTTYMNICNNSISKTGFAALSVFSGIECVAGAVFEIDHHPANYIRHIKEAVASLSVCTNTCCLEFSTAFSYAEELVLDTFDEVLSGMGIPLIGGTSGAKDGEDRSIVSLNGEIYKNTCVFVLIHNLNGRIALYKETLYKPSNKIFTATEVDCEKRIVYEYDGKPAAEALSQALGMNVERFADNIKRYPVGRLIGDEVFLTEPNCVNKDNSIQYLAQIFNQTKVSLIDLDDVQKVWSTTKEETLAQVSNPSFAIAINCIARTKLFETKELLEPFEKQLRDSYKNFICLSGYGEQFDFIHLNLTMALAIFE